MSADVARLRPPTLSAAERRGGATEIASRVDNSLVASAALGYERALAALYARHGPAVYAVAQMLCGPQRAEKITAEVFASLWREPQAYQRGSGPVRSRLVASAHRHAVHALRTTTGARRHGESTTGGDGDAVVDALAELSVSPELRSVVGELPPASRQAIVLAYCAGCDYHEIATRLDLPEKSVLHWIRSGLAQLGTLPRGRGRLVALPTNPIDPQVAPCGDRAGSAHPGGSERPSEAASATPEADLEAPTGPR